MTSRCFVRSVALGVGLLLLNGGAMLAAEVWVVRLFALPVRFDSPAGAVAVGWRDHLFFRNTTTADLTVRGLEASNGYQIPSGEPALVIPAGQTRSLFSLAATPLWTPRAFLGLIVNRLDVPAGILVESRSEAYGCGERVPCDLVITTTIDFLGSFGLPVVSSLRSANESHYHLSTDLGTQDSHTNVGIYNGEGASATATVEVRASCDDAVVETRTVSVPAKTIVYEQGFRNVFRSCAETDVPDYSRYVVVRMNRAGFSFVATRTEAHPPRITVGTTTSR